MRNKLFISDLDGTLLDNKARLSDFSRTSLNTLMERKISYIMLILKMRVVNGM